MKEPRAVRGPVKPLALLLAAALLAGCTNDDASGDSGAGPGATPTTPTAPADAEPVELAVSTSGQYPVNPGFSPEALEAPAGAPVTLTFTNAEPPNPLVQHDWVLEGVEGAATAAIMGGGSATVEFTAPVPGEYAYFCSVGDHRARGMEGTFTAT